MTRVRRRPTHDGQAGAAAVEFALLASVLFLLVFGIIDYGLYVNASMTVGNSAAVSARAVSLGADTVTATSSALVTLQNLPGYNPTWASVSISCKAQATGNAIACNDTATATLKLVDVNVRYQHHWLTPVGLGISTISKTSEMIVE